MYHVVNLCECEIVSSWDDYNLAEQDLYFQVENSDGCYTDMDFAVMDDEDWAKYSGETE
jgi:hypothetical protein